MSTISILVLAILWETLILIVGISGNFPLNDDWVYGWSVKQLADGDGFSLLPKAGSIVYFQVLLGAAVVKLFGFSFVTLRVLMLFLAFVALVSFYFLLRAWRVKATDAVIMVTVLAFNPWFVNLSFTFMTDVPALAFLLLASALFVIGYQRCSASLIALSNLAALASMFIRQSGALFFPVALFSLLLSLHKKGIPRLFIITLFGSLIAAGAYAWLWQKGLLPQVAVSTPLTEDVKVLLPRAINQIVYGLLYIGLFTLPAFVGMAWKERKVFLGGRAFLWLVIVAGVVAGLWIKQGKLFPYIDNVITYEGLGPTADVLQGKETVMFPFWVWWIVTGAATIGMAWLLRFYLYTKLQMLKKQEFPIPIVFVSMLMFMQFALVIMVRSFDRYFLPVLAFFLAYIAMYYGKRIHLLCTVVIGLVLVMGVYSITGTHNYLQWNEMRWREANALGAPPENIEAGYEWCGWKLYQLSQGMPNWPDPSKPWYVNYICPINRGEYVISFSELSGYEVVRKVIYESWYDTSPWLYVLKKL